MLGQLVIHSPSSTFPPSLCLSRNFNRVFSSGLGLPSFLSFLLSILGLGRPRGRASSFASHVRTDLERRVSHSTHHPRENWQLADQPGWKEEEDRKGKKSRWKNVARARRCGAACTTCHEKSYLKRLNKRKAVRQRDIAGRRVTSSERNAYSDTQHVLFRSSMYFYNASRKWAKSVTVHGQEETHSLSGRNASLIDDSVIRPGSLGAGVF